MGGVDPELVSGGVLNLLTDNLPATVSVGLGVSPTAGLDQEATNERLENGVVILSTLENGRAGMTPGFGNQPDNCRILRYAIRALGLDHTQAEFLASMSYRLVTDKGTDRQPIHTLTIPGHYDLDRWWVAGLPTEPDGSFQAGNIVDIWVGAST